MKAKIKIEKFVFTDLESGCASDKRGREWVLVWL